MSELVLLHHNEPMTTSLAIAEGTQNTHESIIKLVRKYVEDLQEFGTFGFEIQKSGGRHTEFAYLNEPQATLLITYLRNNEIVRRFKIALVKAFYELRDRLAGQPPAFETRNLSHGADLAVAADRTFRGFLRSARSSGLPQAQALRVANRKTLDRTGMDMLAELDAEAHVASLEAEAIRKTQAAASHDDPDRYHAIAFGNAWIAGDLPLPAAVCIRSDLHRAYAWWCIASGRNPAGNGKFVSALRSAFKTLRIEDRRLLLDGTLITKGVVIVGNADRSWEGDICRRLGEHATQFAESLAGCLEGRKAA
jgi:phage regulator Rha-like protein